MKNLKTIKNYGLWTMDYRLIQGFTLIEMLVVIAIIAGLATLVVPMLGGVRENAAITTTLNEMKTIKEAIRNRFYPDLRFIPEDTSDPQYATRYLCLKDDGVGGDEYNEMLNFVGAGLINWDKYSRKGWQGPYIERETVYEAESGPPVYFPLIVDAWFNGNELETERKKHYYRIVMDTSQDKDTARIISFGADGEDNGSFDNPITGLPTTADNLIDPDYKTGDDLVMFIFGTGPTRTP